MKKATIELMSYMFYELELLQQQHKDITFEYEQNQYGYYGIYVNEKELSIIMYHIDNSNLMYKDNMKLLLQQQGNKEFNW